MSRLAALEALLAQGRDGALLRFSLGNEHLNGGDPQAAASHLEHAVALDPDYSAAWKLLGKARAALLDSTGAEAAWTAGLASARRKGDKQAEKELQVFLRRLAP
jgi:predicted Zn-dependent protease